MTQALHPAVGFGDDDRIQLRGELDARMGCQLGEVLAQRLATGSDQIELDLSGVEAVDSDGLVALVRAWHEVSARGGRIRLLDPSPVIGPLLAMSGLGAEISG